MGVRFSKCGRSRALSGSMPLISSTRTRLRYRSPSLGRRTCPGHFVAWAQAESADLGLGYVDIAGLGAVAVGVLEEAVAVVRLGQYARGGGVAVVFRNNGVALLVDLLPGPAPTVGC